MLIVFLLRTILSETIKLSGASRRHVAFPAAISTRARSFHREYANVAFERDGGFRIADTGYRDHLHLVDEVANRMIIAAASDCWFGVPAAATDCELHPGSLDYRFVIVSS